MKYQIATIALGCACAGGTAIIGNTLHNMTHGFVVSFVSCAVVLGVLVWRWENA